ncbi:MAG: putative nuclear RNA export factor SDE5 [Treponema sp.]|nr:putative nuclear RNA export factor SDE5 [Treponema sp.]
MKKNVLFGLVFCMFFTACMTTGNRKDVMHGMIVSETNAPISGVEIYHDGKFVARSNANGFFEMQVPLKNELEFTVKKSGWEIKSFSEPYVDSNRLYVYQLHGVESLFSEIEECLKKHDFDSAAILVDDLENKFGDSRNSLFLKSVIAYENGDYESAERFLEESGLSISENQSMKKFHEKIGGAVWNQED